MTKLTSKSLALALAALALFIAGCGDSSSGSDSDNGSGGSTGDEVALTKAEFIKQADALCKKVDEREFGEYTAWIEAEKKALKGLSPDATTEKAIRVIFIPSIRGQIGEMTALGIPEGDEEELEEFFDQVRVGLKKTEKDPLSANGTLEESPFYGAYKVGSAYGFKDCDEIS